MTEFILGRALGTHSERIAAAASDLNRLCHAAWELSGNRGPDLPWSDWIAISALILEFQPTLIVELGRGIGSSTALFQYWSRNFLACDVVSVCNTDHWQKTTVPHLSILMPLSWNKGLDARVGDIVEQDYSAIIAGHPRVLLLWDAHGLAIADAVRTRILPWLEERENIVIGHDLRDSRYFSTDETGVKWLRHGTVFSTFEQIESICGYCESRGIELVSSSHSIKQGADPATMSRLSLVEPFDGICYWHYFSAQSARALPNQ